MPQDTFSAVRNRWPNVLDLPGEEELPITAGLGEEEDPWLEFPEGAGAYTNIPGQVGQPTGTEGSEELFQLRGQLGGVSDEQAQRWYEQVQAENAKVKLEMLADDILNSRNKLVDELYGGKDPALQNTKELKDKLTQMNVKSFKDTAGDPEELSDRDRLLYASAIVDIGKQSGLTVETEKQNNIQRLSEAVSQYNAGIAQEMKLVQGGMEAIQEKHMAEDEAAAGVLEAQIGAIGKGGPKQPSPVTWTTATKQLSRRFGKEDPMGNIIVTPELAGMNRISQKKLVELKKQGMEPLEAINVAEAFARHVDATYWKWKSASNRTKKDQEDFDKQFKARYGYIPRIPPR